MNSTESFPLRKSVPWRTLDTEALVVDVKSGLLYPLNSVGARIWDLCDGKRDVAQIVSSLCAAFDAPESTVRADVLEFLGELRRERLLVVDTA